MNGTGHIRVRNTNTRKHIHPAKWAHRAARAVKYATVGVIGTFVHWGVLIVLVERFGTEPVLATSIGFGMTLALSFFLNLYWTFSIRPGSAGVVRRGFRYVLVSLGGLLLNSGLMYVTVHVAQISYLIGQTASLFVVPAFNYVLNAAWTFRETNRAFDGRP